MSSPKFTVDTHLFRELGELLVGRDSTALVELIKNSYDADATRVTVLGERLDDRAQGRIVISDDGGGMTPQQFNDGFLRVASRLKETGERRSKRYGRRFTGAKGVGRLAAHKLAELLTVESIADLSLNGPTPVVRAKIDWAKVEEKSTLDELEGTDAISLETPPRPPNAKPGTTITLRRLRRKWTATERANFFAEVQSFNPPAQLVDLPGADRKELLFGSAHVRDTTSTDSRCRVELIGEFESGDDYWQALANAAQWIVEIDAFSEKGKITVNVLPARQVRKELPDAERGIVVLDHPSPSEGPFFQARILVREGNLANNAQERAWVGRASGIRVYMEGFRVLPYGEPNDDWLSLDADYNKRQKSLHFLPEFSIPSSDDPKEGLVSLRKGAYFGAVFLTQSQAPTLRMLVNREGFVPDAAFLRVVDIVRTGINLSIRQRAAAKRPSREERSETRKESAARSVQPARLDLRRAVELSVSRASENAREARKLAVAGDIEGAHRLIEQAAAEFTAGSRTSERLMTEGSILRVLASVGTQMAAFVHEIQQLLGSATALEQSAEKLRADPTIAPAQRSQLVKLHTGLGELRRAIERHASYLLDVASPDARRRRSRQKLAERFDAAHRLVHGVAGSRGIEIRNEIPVDLRSPPIFPAEITLVLSNLLTNAVKAAGNDGRIRAKAHVAQDGTIHLKIENTGVAVNLKDAERWFRPFESTSVITDPVLGQGMGLGLPITRNMLEDYGATIQFSKPSSGYSTALEIIFPH